MLPKAFIFLILGVSPQAVASGENMDIAVRTGMISAIYDSPDIVSGNFTVNFSLDAEIDYFLNPKLAWLARTTLGLDQKTSRTRYFYVGTGQRWFPGSIGFEQVGLRGDDVLTIKPKTSYYVGWDAGLSQIQLLSLGEVLGSYSTVAEIGGLIGVKSRLNSKWSFDANLGGSYGLGMGGVNVTSQIIRLFAGMIYLF